MEHERSEATRNLPRSGSPPRSSRLAPHSSSGGAGCRCAGRIALRDALQQIARGSGVVFQVAGLCGLGALQVAKEKGVWGIGVDEDQSVLGSFVLTSVLKNFDVGLFKAIRSLQRGTFRTGTTVEMTLAGGGVGLGKISPRVPRALIGTLDRLREQIVAGRIAVPQTLSR